MDSWFFFQIVHHTKVFHRIVSSGTDSLSKQAVSVPVPKSCQTDEQCYHVFCARTCYHCFCKNCSVVVDHKKVGTRINICTRTMRGQIFCGSVMVTWVLPARYKVQRKRQESADEVQEGADFYGFIDILRFLLTSSLFCIGAIKTILATKGNVLMLQLQFVYTWKRDIMVYSWDKT